jgi:hypothetical protein
MNAVADRPSRICTGVLLAFTALLFAFLAWRVLLPNNRQQPAVDFQVMLSDGVEHYVPHMTNALRARLSCVWQAHRAGPADQSRNEVSSA